MDDADYEYDDDDNDDSGAANYMSRHGTILHKY